MSIAAALSNAASGLAATARATEMGWAMSSIAATAPTWPLSSMMTASSVTRPSRSG